MSCMSHAAEKTTPVWANKLHWCGGLFLGDVIFFPRPISEQKDILSFYAFEKLPSLQVNKAHPKLLATVLTQKKKKTEKKRKKERKKGKRKKERTKKEKKPKKAAPKGHKFHSIHWCIDHGS